MRFWCGVSGPRLRFTLLELNSIIRRISSRFFIVPASLGMTDIAPNPAASKIAPRGGEASEFATVDSPGVRTLCRSWGEGAPAHVTQRGAAKGSAE